MRYSQIQIIKAWGKNECPKFFPTLAFDSHWASSWLTNHKTQAKKSKRWKLFNEEYSLQGNIDYLVFFTILISSLFILIDTVKHFLCLIIKKYYVRRYQMHKYMRPFIIFATSFKVKKNCVWHQKCLSEIGFDTKRWTFYNLETTTIVKLYLKVFYHQSTFYFNDLWLIFKA
jgi:hypothetical protein